MLTAMRFFGASSCLQRGERMDNPSTDNPQVSSAQPKSAQEREKEFSEAVERVYRRYGNNLSAFLRDVQREMELLKRG
jgi:hypothetical protein